ncbi:hypothetical protein BJY52DRAFT_880589 [Lactarius psammicola]|nr:hypothetical protein BJY52DRAFT_880589 [Lactarius psammicola]
MELVPAAGWTAAHYDDGPWTMLQIMRVDDGQVEQYTCAMPRYYAVPLILINKRLAYFEAQCTPDGTPLPSGDGSVGLKQRELKEYTYFWRLRCRFLQDVFDMNHERQLDEAWRCDRIHGYVHRTYKRYGHDAYQRHAYWRDEIEAGRIPYATPDIADMDWGAFLAEEMTTSTRFNAFLWNRISQGYSRLVRDDPPLARWQAWRRGGTSRDLSVSLFRTPPPSARFPAPERTFLSEEPDGTAEQEEVHEQEHGSREMAAAATTTNCATQESTAAQNSCGATLHDGDNSVNCTGVLAAAFDGSQVLALPFPTSGLLRGTSPAAASTGGTGDPSRRRITLLLDVPQDMALTDLLCTLSRVEDDVSNDCKPTLRFNYPPDHS